MILHPFSAQIKPLQYFKIRNDIPLWPAILLWDNNNGGRLRKRR